MNSTTSHRKRLRLWRGRDEIFQMTQQGLRIICELFKEQGINHFATAAGKYKIKPFEFVLWTP